MCIQIFNLWQQAQPQLSNKKYLIKLRRLCCLLFLQIKLYYRPYPIINNKNFKNYFMILIYRLVISDMRALYKQPTQLIGRLPKNTAQEA